jgi:hypothetical protein
VSRTTPADQTDRRLLLLVAVVAGLGVVAVTASLADLTGLVGDPVASPPWHWLAVYILLVAGSSHLNVQVRIRSTRIGLSWVDAVILVGLATWPVSWVVAATATGVLVFRVIQRSPPIKLVYAVAKASLTTFTAGLVLLGAGSLGQGTAWKMVSLAAAFLVIVVIDKPVTTAAIALDSRTRLADRLRANWDIELAAHAGRLGVALVAVLVLERQPQLVYAVPLLVLLAHVWHEQWVRAREERRAWQEHAATTASFADVELDTVLRRAVTGGARLFSAEALEVQLWLIPPRRLVRGGPDGVTYDGDPADAPPEPALVDVHEVRLHGRSGQPGIGALRLRFRDRVKLSEREEAMLATFAAALESAVRNAAAYGLLRHSH